MNDGGWIETPVADGESLPLLRRGEYVIRVGDCPVYLEALSRLFPNPLVEDDE